jgi:hypothetical protein
MWTERGMLIDRITFQALHDNLTGLANRANFSERLAGAAKNADATAAPFSIFYLDLDLFKSINDTLGHDIGDELLREVATPTTSTHSCATPTRRCTTSSVAITSSPAPRGCRSGLDLNDQPVPRQSCSVSRISEVSAASPAAFGCV